MRPLHSPLEDLAAYAIVLTVGALAALGFSSYLKRVRYRASTPFRDQSAFILDMNRPKKDAHVH